MGLPRTVGLGRARRRLARPCPAWRSPPYPRRRGGLRLRDPRCGQPFSKDSGCVLGHRVDPVGGHTLDRDHGRACLGRPRVNVRWMWAAGLAVAAAAAVSTAHGSYEVAHAAGVPTPVAALYPAIGDGLALVAYATTARLEPAARRYAWAVVVLAAGMSGIAQASWLAGGLHAVPAPLRFGIGAWPAVAA